MRKRSAARPNAVPRRPPENIANVAVPLADLMPTGRVPSGSLAMLAAYPLRRTCRIGRAAQDGA